MFALTLAACAFNTPTGGSDPGSDDGSGKGDGLGDGSGGGSGSGSGSGSGFAPVPDVQCSGAPDAGPAGSFNHVSSEIISALGDPKHRGFDLVAPASADPQFIQGWIAYTIADKALEDENVDLFACIGGAWQAIGSATTDDEGSFSLTLTGASTLPIGMRDMYVSVTGDRTGTNFLAYVAPDGSPLLASDVDGTLTSSEDAFAETIVLGIEPDAQPGAATAYAGAQALGYQPIYITARGNEYTADTRQWLSDKGFPRGPVRLSPSFITLPGGDTIDYKTSTITALEAGLDVAIGVGNRDSDITAYTNSDVAPDRIFILLPEFQSECQADLDAGKAIGFTAYSDLASTYLANL
jgi:hypothetical protein